jgi:H+/Cl- antiporter ClcA
MSCIVVVAVWVLQHCVAVADKVTPSSCAPSKTQMFKRPLNVAIQIARWVAFAVVIGLASGVLSASFIAALNWATTTRTSHNGLLFLLPLAGLLVGATYHYGGRGLERGSNLVIEQIHGQSEWIPFRLTPLIFSASVISHVAGASVGREGAAIQLAAGVTDPLSKRLGLPPTERSIMLVTAIAGAFGSVFGVPVAGAIFALEVQRVGRIRYEALVPAFVASFVGDAVVRGIGIDHTHFPTMTSIDFNVSAVWKLVVFGCLAGIVAWAFIALTHFIRRTAGRLIPWYPARPLIGGVILVIVIAAFGWRDYSGLSMPLALEAMNGSATGQWGTKFALTSLSIGMGFVGGEFIPLFVIGALAGASFASITGGNIAVFALIGSVAVLAGATNTPLACTVLGLELFGGQGLAWFAIACVIAYATSGNGSIYHAQIGRVPTTRTHTTN